MGKAKNLNKRLRQYALLQDTRPQIHTLVEQTAIIHVQELGSELEALLVEAELIRRYQPPYNILLKDDKSDLYICLSHDSFPRIFTARKPEVMRAVNKLTTFGPFPSGLRVRQVLSIARKIFRWCDHPYEGTGKKKACFYAHIGLCAGACLGNVSESEYGVMIASLKKFLRGSTGSLKSDLKAEIAQAANQHQFEQAARLRDQLQALITVTAPEYRLSPDLVLPVLTSNFEQEALVSLRAVLRQYLTLPATAPLTRIEGYDISNIQGTNATASMVVALNGQMTNSEYRHFGIKTLKTPNDYLMMKETLIRRQKHPEWGIPDVIVIDGGKGQLRAALSVWKWPTIVVSLAKRPDRLIIPLLSREYRPGAKPSTAVLLDPAEVLKNIMDAKTTTPMKISYKEIPLTPELPATRLLQSIRDESHRFAKRLHTIKRNTNLLPS